MTRQIARLAARLFAEGALAAFCLAFAIVLWVRATPLPALARAQPRSVTVTAASGEPLWAFLAADQKWRLSVRPDEVDPHYLSLLIAWEDQRFRKHHGVDGLALARAALQAVRHGRIVSGGSTLTMQVVRMLEPRPRTFAAKVEEILQAIKLEQALPKQKILELYLNLAPFGGNVEGVRAASLLYFGKEPKRLSLAEAALLAAVPQSPEARRPDLHRDEARGARDRVLTTLAARHAIDAASAARATREGVPARMHPLTRSAPHLAMRLRDARAAAAMQTLPTLIDAPLQVAVEKIAGHAIASWGDAVNIAILVLRNRDASVAAYLGGVDLSSASRKGFVDLVQAVRSPGSALKPFIYAMAFDKLIVHPETIITDQAIEIDGYRPDNADGQFAGDISVRQALIRSRNTTAVMLLDRVGIDAFLARFRSAGRPLLLPGSDSDAGLAVALGGVGVSLEQLTWFYTMFANDGQLKALRIRPSDPPASLGQFVSPAAARATADILADVPAPPGFVRQLAGDGGRRIGFKTGTSYGFRDAWAVGFDELHTVGVWVGRPDGAAHLGAYGATAAAPILLQVFDRLPVPPHDAGAGHADLGALTSYRELPQRLIRFAPLDRSGARPLEITFPRNGAQIHGEQGPRGIELPLTVSGGRPPYRWTLAGVAAPPSLASVKRWTIDNRGQLDISVMDSAGNLARSSFWID